MDQKRLNDASLWFALLLILLQACNDPSTEIDTRSSSDHGTADQAEESDDTQSLTHTVAIDYLALGDSYTTGSGIDLQDGWPEQLVASMRETGIHINDPVIIARAGWTTGQLIVALENRQLDEKFDLVSLQIGVNNQYLGQGITTFKRDLEILLDRCVTLSDSGKGVFMLSIPDYGATPFGQANADAIGAEIDTYNAHISQRCNARNIRYYDITDISRMAVDNPSLVASDNLHPSPDMYALWVTEIIRGVVSLIEQLQKG